MSISELISLVAVSLGAPLAGCGDGDNDGSIAITELITAVANGLNGCPG